MATDIATRVYNHTFRIDPAGRAITISHSAYRKLGAGPQEIKR